MNKLYSFVEYGIEKTFDPFVSFMETIYNDYIVKHYKITFSILVLIMILPPIIRLFI